MAPMTRAFILKCVLVFCASTALAQSSNSDRCVVSSGDVQTKKSAVLGSFNTIIGEEELTTKAFKLPNTGFFIVASVFYTDESMASEKGLDSVSLELALSKGKKRDVLGSLSWAEAEMPLSSFDVGRVSMLIKVNGRAQLVLMECKKDVRR
jgi:hypothetical protein